jgi:hypothetical protein
MCVCVAIIIICTYMMLLVQFLRLLHGLYCRILHLLSHMVLFIESLSLLPGSGGSAARGASDL